MARNWTSLIVLVGLLASPMVLSAQEQERRPTRPPAPALNFPPTAANESEAKILAVLQDMYDHQRQGMMNVPPDDGRFLRVITEALGAKHVVEIGTSNGYSSIWICLGLRTTGGKLTTHEIDARRASLARENFKRAGVSDLVNLVEGDAHQEILKLKEPIDILFLDADKPGYTDYLKKILPLVREGGLIIAHNVASHASQMQDYFKATTTDPNLESVFVNKQGPGIGITLKKRQARQSPNPK